MQQLVRFFLLAFFKVILLLVWTSSTESHAQSKRTSVNINKNRGKTTISIKEGWGNNFYLEFEGEITLSDDDKDIVAISRGGYLEIKKSAFGSRRRILMEPDDSGRLIKKYYVGGSKQNFEPEGRRWLGEILPDILRSSTIAAKQRVDRMYGKGGANAVLREVDLIRSDYVKSAYLKLLLKKDLSNNDLIGVMRVVGEDVESDHHQAEILKHNARAFLATDATTDAYIRAAASINSDHHMASVLRQLVKDADVSESQLESLFEIMDRINSDHHKAEVLLTVLNSRSMTDRSVALLLKESQSINSDHHQARVLKAALKTPGLSSKEYNSFLYSARNIGSDHHIASVCGQLLNEKLDEKELNALMDLVRNNMTSDHHQASILVKASRNQDLTKENIAGMNSALKSMSSDHHKAEVFKQLSTKQLDEQQMISVLEAIKTINSDYHKTSSLLAFSGAARDMSANVKDAYRETCGGINSESHYGRAIRAIQ